MPTCSQAKIISNLEFDINKRVNSLVSQEQQQQEVITSTRLPPPHHVTTHRIVEEPRYLRLRSNTEYQPQQVNNTKYTSVSRRSLAKQLNQFSHDELAISNYNIQMNRRLPAINNIFQTRKDSVPVNFLFNSNLRNKSGGAVHHSPIKGLRKNSSPTDNDDFEGTPSDVNSSWSSSGSEQIAHENKKHSGDNSHRDNLQQYEFTRRQSTNFFSSLPRLALEIEQINDTSSENTNSNEEDTQRALEKAKRFSITGAKRLLALASIRPSKTFHKEITNEEADILNKYYDIIKPKVRINIPSADSDDNEDKARNIEIPILYNSAKINYDTFSSLEMFLTEYKSELSAGKYQIEHNMPGYSGFVLKNTETEAIVQFPPHVHDTFIALAMSANAKGNTSLDEAHILKSIHWNDTRHILAPKQPGRKMSKTSSNVDPVKAKGVPSVSIDDIKEMTRLVRTIIEPKLLKKVSDNGIDLSALPGGMNFELPPPTNDLEQTTDPSKIEAQVAASIGGTSNNGKLKNVVYKKLKDKVASTKVMWFTSPPVFKNLSVVFEYAGFDLSHETILEDVNKYLESNGVRGQVVEIEFVPRSVQFGSVNVQNLWILTLSDKDAKFYTISHGIEINGQKVVPKSYDDYIYTEYEKYIRTEKYKQMIKTHEKVLSKSSNIPSNSNK